MTKLFLLDAYTVAKASAKHVDGILATLFCLLKVVGITEVRHRLYNSRLATEVRGRGPSLPAARVFPRCGRLTVGGAADPLTTGFARKLRVGWTGADYE